MAIEIIKRKFKTHSLTGRITIELMRKAFKAVKQNRGAAGIDKVSIEMYETSLDQNLESLMNGLKSGTYQPIPLRRVYIEKGEGKLRPLGIPAVRCRVAQEVVRRLIEQTFERLFHKDSYGFRKYRNCHQAVKRVKKLIRQGYAVVLDADILGFFDSIIHDVIMKLVSEEIADGNILKLIEKCLRSGVMEDGVVRPTRQGTPQGGVISPLLANIVLNYLDRQMDT